MYLAVVNFRVKCSEGSQHFPQAVKAFLCLELKSTVSFSEMRESSN